VQEAVGGFAFVLPAVLAEGGKIIGAFVLDRQQDGEAALVGAFWKATARTVASAGMPMPGQRAEGP
jgi:hypothetical protein